MKNFLFKTAAVRLGHFHLEVALRNGGATVGSIAIHTHRAEVHHVDVLARFHDRCQQVVGAVDVVVNGVALGSTALHRVRRSSLFGEVHDRIRLLFDDEVEKPLVLVGDIHMDESHGLAANAFPHVQTFTDAHDRRQRFHLKVDVDLATAEVVHD
eukprot:CAMPEP_0175899130 /NCGR_PEP_ID=MMETSP0108-20121206/1623_2 /TAXON_ID=195067 ORGANISM="Goniomonas pacifica, Strain CCMP1869" /NCGR_SAMPLE_ID=MMETSP0108 /ASSEMBLY_ACC=CAM_ASM_000204 /LENGTH=154 /DNA_ID=CAMNT_0017220543 /DNA_START=51 /DNA_END=512 /DNA_ORIENTATION=-